MDVRNVGPGNSAPSNSEGASLTAFNQSVAIVANKIIGVKSRDEALKLLQSDEVPYHSFFSYPSSRKPNTICLIEKYPGAASSDINNLTVHPIDSRLKLNSMVDDMFYPYMNIFESEVLAHNFIRENPSKPPFAFWVDKGADKTRTGAVHDKFGVDLSNVNPLMMEVRTLVDPSNNWVFTHKNYSSNTHSYERVRMVVIAEQLSVCNSLLGCTITSVFPTFDKAKSFVMEQNNAFKEFYTANPTKQEDDPVHQSFKAMAFYSNEAGEFIMVTTPNWYNQFLPFYSKWNGEIKQTVIKAEDLRGIIELKELMIHDYARFIAHTTIKLANIEPHKFSLFTNLHDRAQMSEVHRQKQIRLETLTT